MSRLKESIILAIGLVLLGMNIKWGINNFVNRDRKVTVKGLAEREVKADKVTWSISTVEMGNDLPTLYDKVQAQTGKVQQFLVGNGINADDITIMPPSVTDLEANQWSENRKNFRYIITAMVTVSTGDVETVNATIMKQGELMKQGVAIESEYPSYEYVSFQEMKNEMMAEAIRKAQQTGEEFAKASSSKLGKIITAGQGQFEIEDRDENTPYIKKLRVVTTVTYALDD